MKPQNPMARQYGNLAFENIIIRNNDELDKTRQYIINNPLRLESVPYVFCKISVAFGVQTMYPVNGFIHRG